MGISADGFAPIPAQSTAGISAFVESGRISQQLPPVILQATTGGFSTSGGNVVVTLLDAATGEPINTATVTAGVASTSAASNGTYTLAVPGTGATPVGLSAQAEGYDPNTLTPREVTFVPGQAVTLTARIAPSQPGSRGASWCRARSEPALDRGDPRGRHLGRLHRRQRERGHRLTFRLTVPASNSSPRVFSLTFVSPFFNLVVVPNVVAPAGGSLSLPGDVILTPIGVGLSGTVLDSGSRIRAPAPR